MRNWVNLDIVFRKSLDEASERLYDIERGHKEVASDFSLGESLVLFFAHGRPKEESQQADGRPAQRVRKKFPCSIYAVQCIGKSVTIHTHARFRIDL